MMKRVLCWLLALALTGPCVAQELLPVQWKFKTGDDPAWASPSFDDSGWSEIIPGEVWENQGFPGYDGFAWYRTSVVIPSTLKSNALEYGGFLLQLGKIDDVDFTYLNGEFLAGLGELPPNYVTRWDEIRNYTIPAGKILWDQPNTLAVRVFDLTGGGGIYGEPILLTVHGPADHIMIEPAFAEPDHILKGSQDMNIPIRLINNFHRPFTGKIGIRVVSDFGEEIYGQEQNLTLNAKKQILVNFTIQGLRPGFYKALVTLASDIATKKISFAFGYEPEKIYSPPDPRPDFDDYWARAKRELNAVDPQFNMIKIDSLCTSRRNVYLVEMRSLGNILIRGWYSVPTAPGKYPAVMQVHGYQSVILPEYVDYGDDLIGFGLHIRGHGNSRDHVNPGFPGFLQSFLEDKEMYIYRGGYMDCVRGVDFLFSRPEVDTSRVAVEGASQGGALTFATAALCNDRITVCAPQVPFLSDFEDYFRVATWPGNEFISMVVEQKKMTWEEVYNTLSYIDIKNLAGWIRAPMIMGVGLADDVCPPHINFAAYNQVKSEKQYIVYPESGHGLPEDFYFKKMAFIRQTFFPDSLPSTGSDVRTRENFNRGWKFLPGDPPGASAVLFDDSGWRPLNLPHDWSIEGDFNVQNPSSPGGGALPGGIGWYRNTFHIPSSDRGKNIYAEFDGVYRMGEVWINGHYLGKRPYGYSSFRYELTQYLNYGNEANVISVRVDNSQQPNSRWYSGSGIYRNVWLVKTGSIAVDHWGTYVTTPTVTENDAEVNIRTRIRNTTGTSVKISVKSSIYDHTNKLISEKTSPGMLVSTSGSEIKQTITVPAPELWSVDNPVMYRVVTTLLSKEQVLDEYITPFGIRSFEFSSTRGFLLNGKPLKINGVCNHHDLGCLGAAINTRGLERQLELLKAMGCNGIRTSHNPPAPELLDLCDRMGFIVMDEAFDMWKISKTPFDYSADFDVWHRRDLEDLVLRDRNHPSVFIWSIGNEIMEQWDTSGTRIARELASIVRKLDDTRPITAACNDPKPENYLIRSKALDLIGYNYHEENFAQFPELFPGQKFLATETTSALATRGSYDMPSDSIRRWPLKWDVPFYEGNADMSCSAYDNCSAPWGSTHEETWKIVKKYDFMSGMFIWTGFDYIGEPTPYPWPARSSYFGILDLCGFPKDAYYLYKSEWTSEPVLHLFPHWNWAPGQMIDVWAYSNCDEVELWLNGTSLGTQRKTGDMLHFSWRVPFEAGTLRATGKQNGKVILTREIQTAGEPYRIVLSPDRNAIRADGDDLSYVTVTVVDKNNVVVPYADNRIYFTVEGNGELEATDNGNQVSMESFKSHERRAFHGMCLAVVRSGLQPGNLVLKASADGLQPAGCTLQLLHP